MAGVRPSQKGTTSVPGPSSARFVHGSYPPSASKPMRVKPAAASSRDYGKPDDMPPIPFGNTSMTGRS